MNVYGASGHAKVIIGILKSRKLKIHHIIDDNKLITKIFNYPVVHEVDSQTIKKKTIISIGNNKMRKRVANKLDSAIYQAVSHTSAIIDATVQMGDGTVVMANAAINADAIIGRHCIINTAAVVEHDCILEDFVHISPNAVLAGGVVVGEGTHVGIGAAIIPGISIGEWSTIGAGAVIIEDVPAFSTVVGNPGKVLNRKD